MKWLLAFKIVFVLFILALTFVYNSSGDKLMLLTYLAMGSFALFSVLLHIILDKLIRIEQHLARITSK